VIPITALDILDLKVTSSDESSAKPLYWMV